MSGASCDTCRFWPAWPNDKGGLSGLDGHYSECRRHAPAPAADGPGLYTGLKRQFPVTRRDEFCGDLEQARRDPLGRDEHGVTPGMRAYLAGEGRATLRPRAASETNREQE